MYKKDYVIGHCWKNQSDVAANCPEIKGTRKDKETKTLPRWKGACSLFVSVQSRIGIDDLISACKNNGLGINFKHCCETQKAGGVIQRWCQEAPRCETGVSCTHSSNPTSVTQQCVFILFQDSWWGLRGTKHLTFTSFAFLFFSLNFHAIKPSAWIKLQQVLLLFLPLHKN